MKRGKPIVRRTPLRRKTRLRQVSPKRLERMKAVKKAGSPTRDELLSLAAGLGRHAVASREVSTGRSPGSAKAKVGLLLLPAYLKWTRQQPCWFCGAPPPSDPQHVEVRGRGLTLDLFVLPACRRCHRDCQEYRIDESQQWAVTMLHLLRFVTTAPPETRTAFAYQLVAALDPDLAAGRR